MVDDVLCIVAPVVLVLWIALLGRDRVAAFGAFVGTCSLIYSAACVWLLVYAVNAR